MLVMKGFESGSRGGKTWEWILYFYLMLFKKKRNILASHIMIILIYHGFENYMEVQAFVTACWEWVGCDNDDDDNNINDIYINNNNGDDDDNNDSNNNNNNNDKWEREEQPIYLTLTLHRKLRKP